MLVGFLFDNDGVLIDSSALHWKSWQLLMQEQSAFSMDYDAFVKGFGKRNDLILKENIPNSTQGQRVQWAERKEELFREIAKGNVSLLPGIETFLKKVKASKIPRIIASSTPRANLELYVSSTVLGEYFTDYSSAEEVPYGKPAPDIFLHAAKKLNIAPENCIVFEDAPAGIEAGSKAGAFIVALGTTHAKQQLKDYNLFYDSPHQLNLDEILKEYQWWQAHDRTKRTLWD